MIGEFRFLYFRIIHEVESEKTYLKTTNIRGQAFYKIPSVFVRRNFVMNFF